MSTTITEPRMLASIDGAIDVPPGYKRTEIGVIPEDWEERPLLDIATKITDGEHVTPKRTGDGYYLLSARNILNGLIDLMDVDYVGPEEFQRIRKRCNPESGDVLISCSGSIGRVAVVPLGLDCVLVRSAALVKIEAHKADSVFIQYEIQSSLVQKQIDQSLNQGAQPNLFLNHIERLIIPFPPFSEQRAIAEALSDVDGLIEALKKLIAKKRDIKQATMQQLFKGKMRLPGFSGEWEVKRLGDLLDRVIGGGTPSRSNPRFWGPDIPWVTVKDFASFHPRETQEYITKEGLSNSASNLIPAGTLIISTRMALGQAVIYEVDVCINQDLKALFFKRFVSVQYMYHWLGFHANVMEELGSGSTVKGLSLSDLKAIPFKLPTYVEQAAIAAVLSDMDAEIEALEQRLEKTRQIKQGMMQQLLTGRVRLVQPKEAETTP